MEIEIKKRPIFRPLVHTHAIYVDGVAVGFGSESSLRSALESLQMDPAYAEDLKLEFENEPEEW